MWLLRPQTGTHWGRPEIWCSGYWVSDDLGGSSTAARVAPCPPGRQAASCLPSFVVPPTSTKSFGHIKNMQLIKITSYKTLNSDRTLKEYTWNQVEKHPPPDHPNPVLQGSPILNVPPSSDFISQLPCLTLMNGIFFQDPSNQGTQKDNPRVKNIFTYSKKESLKNILCHLHPWSHERARNWVAKAKAILTNKSCASSISFSKERKQLILF